MIRRAALLTPRTMTLAAPCVPNVTGLSQAAFLNELPAREAYATAAALGLAIPPELALRVDRFVG